LEVKQVDGLKVRSLPRGSLSSVEEVAERTAAAIKMLSSPTLSSSVLSTPSTKKKSKRDKVNTDVENGNKAQEEVVLETEKQHKSHKKSKKSKHD
jgi:gas vesicle protein